MKAKRNTVDWDSRTAAFERERARWDMVNPQSRPNDGSVLGWYLSDLPDEYHVMFFPKTKEFGITYKDRTIHFSVALRDNPHAVREVEHQFQALEKNGPLLGHTMRQGALKTQDFPKVAGDVADGLRKAFSPTAVFASTSTWATSATELYFDVEGSVCSKERWLDILQHPETHVVGDDFVKGYLVRTVWLPCDYRPVGTDSPVVWESTCTPQADYDDFELAGRWWRYASLDNALRGHDYLVSSIINGDVSKDA